VPGERAASLAGTAAPDGHEASSKDLPRLKPRWPELVVATMLLLSALSVVHLALLEFGRFRTQAIAIDEMFFSACAARGVATGQIPVAGCHDNKGPVIFFVHQLVQLASSRYDLLAIKVVAFALVGLVGAGVALLAFRLGGRIAALAAGALCLQAFATESTHLGLKTETVAMLFVLAGLALSLDAHGRWNGRSSWWRWSFSGACLGVAVLTKPTYAVVALAQLVAYVAAWLGRPQRSLRAALADATSFALGMALPFATALLAFMAQGRAEDFLSSYLLYPSVYGQAVDTPLWKTSVWKASAVIQTLASTPLLLTLFAVELVGLGLSLGHPRLRRRLLARGRFLMLLATLSLALPLALAPHFFSYHVVPLTTLMAVPAALVAADLVSFVNRGLVAKHALNQLSLRAGALLATALLLPSLLMASTSWSSHGGTSKPPTPAQGQELEADGKGQFAYVLGMWPTFYVNNGLVPASDVLFPWALAGAPPNFFYSLPPAGSLRHRLFTAARERGERQLLADFGQTPPRYIVVVVDMARAPNSKRVSDVIGLDDYLARQCHRQSDLVGPKGSSAVLFRCAAPGEPDPPGPLSLRLADLAPQAR